MSLRSANATIKGYFYQFDHTIVQLLQASTLSTSITVEGVEDVDVQNADDTTLIQCKYYEGTDYSHSVIKGAIIQMLRHFHQGSHATSPAIKYRIYGHFKSGQDKLPSTLDLLFLKAHFLTFTEKKITHEVHVELSISDASLLKFLDTLTIDVRGQSYDSQQTHVRKLLASQMDNASDIDVDAFYYPLAIHTMQTLAIKKSEADRRLTKSQFIKQISRRDVVFSAWLEQKFGREYYTRSVNRKYFRIGGTKIPKVARIFAFSLGGHQNVAQCAQLLTKLGERYSHTEHTRTPAEDRFCPYVLISDATADEIISIKTTLTNSGVKIFEGYPFCGAQFSPSLLAVPPSKENLYRIKFIPSAQYLSSLIYEIKGVPTEIFEFFKVEPNRAIAPPATILHQKIRAESVSVIMEMI